MCTIPSAALGPFHTLLLKSQKTQGGIYHLYTRKEGESKKREKRKKRMKEEVI